MTDEERAAAEAAAAAKAKADDEALNKKLNAAITARLKDFGSSLNLDQRFTQLREEMTGAVSTTLGEALKAFRPNALPPVPPSTLPGQPPGAPPIAAPGPLKLDEIPEFAELKKVADDQRKALETLQKKAKADAEEKAVLAKKQREDAFKQAVLDSLNEAGVKDAKAAKLAFHALHGEGMIRYADEGKGDEVVFVADGEEKNLGAQVRAWVKTPEGKRFLPAITPNGSGAPTAPGGAGRQPDNTKIKTLAEMRAEARKRIVPALVGLMNGETTNEETSAE
jgi:hypothetical protein